MGLMCSNATRSYSNAIAMRQAAAISRECKDVACVGVSLVLTLGRGAGAFFGMGLATLPGGLNSAAGCIAGLSLLMLMPLAAPTFLKELRSAWPHANWICVRKMDASLTGGCISHR